MYVNNCSVVDLVNKWNVSGHTQHVDVQYSGLRNLKEEGQLIVEWINTESNTADLFTKNLGGTTFEKHGQVLFEMTEETFWIMHHNK